MDKKCYLCQADFLCNNGKEFVLSNSTCHRFEKTISNQWKSTDLLAALRNVFNNIISRPEIAYTPNEHITINGQLVGVER